MRLRKLSLTLPSHLAGTAHHDARAIGEALARELAKGAAPSSQITVTGQTGAQIAQNVAAQMPRKGGSYGR